MSDQPSIDLKKLVPSVAASLELADEGAAEERLHEALVSGERASQRVPQEALEEGTRASSLGVAPVAMRPGATRRRLSPWLLLLALVAIVTPMALAMMLIRGWR